MPRAEMVNTEDEQKVIVPEQTVKVKPDFRKYLNVYEFDVTLPSGTKLKLKPITAGQLKRFMTSIKENTVKELSAAMYDMISTSVVGEDFDISDIFLNDRSALILELRKISKGTEFKFEYKCPSCKSQSIITEDLNNIKIIPMPEKINPIVELDENLSVQMDYVKIKDEQDILNMGLVSEAELLLSVIAVSVQSIITPDGDQDNLSLEDKIFFTDEIPTPLYEKITNWHERFHFGIDLKKKVTCTHCKKDSDFDLDADNFFF